MTETGQQDSVATTLEVEEGVQAGQTVANPGPRRRDLPPQDVPAGRHLIITVHGIRTFGQWQERLEALLKRGAHPGERLEVVHYKYGYFSAFAFLSVALRWVAVRRFRAELLSLTREPCTRVDIVAHSFGTYLVARAL